MSSKGAVSREVADAVFDFLHSEIVQHVRATTPDTDDYKDEVYLKLERLGFRIGQCIAERLTRESPRFKDQLDVIKFICKDFWTFVFGKQVDNLRTNHRGVYVMHDKEFRLFTHMSRGKQYVDQAAPFLALPCGLVRGSLAALGIGCTVSGDVGPQLPSCTFQVKLS